MIVYLVIKQGEARYQLALNNSYERLPQIGEQVEQEDFTVRVTGVTWRIDGDVDLVGNLHRHQWGVSVPEFLIERGFVKRS